MHRSDVPSEDIETLIYAFEQEVLARSAFELHTDVMNELRGAPADTPFMHLLSKTVVGCSREGRLVGRAPPPAVLRALIERVGVIRVHAVPLEDQMVYVLTMSEPEVPTQAAFIAIVIGSSAGPAESRTVRFFLLEKSALGGALLCERTVAGSHINYGLVEPGDRDRFLAAVMREVRL